MDNKVFDKYEQRGPYHWDWYEKNQFSYKDKLHMIRLHLPTQGSVLDIGGGDGVLSYLLFQHGLKVTCLDSNPCAIELGNEKLNEVLYGQGLLGRIRAYLSKKNIRPIALAQRYESGEITFLAQSIFDLDINKPFDYIVCHEVIEHIPDPEKLLKWIHKNMTKYAIISTPDVTNRSPHDLDYHSWTPETFSEFLTGYRFEFIFKDGHDMYIKLYK